MGKLMVVVGGQFGSEAKGACAAALAARSDEPLVVRTGGPNAGHTVWGGTPHQEFKLRQLPTAAISNPNARLAIAAGSVVDPDLLNKEITETGTDRFVMVDEMATILESGHLDREALDSGLHNWSTQKGIGAARAERIMRRAKIWRDVHHFSPQTTCSDVAYLVRRQLQAGGDVVVEAAQGYGLGLHTTYYPKTTSSDCRAIDALAAVGVSPWMGKWYEIEVWVVLRPYPIRVAGESGPLRNEVSWQELGLPEERTTVTNKVRRVGLWDAALAEAAIRANGGPSPAVRVWFSMADQVIPQIRGITDPQNLWDVAAMPEVGHELRNWNALVRQAGAPIYALGTGPDTHVMVHGRMP